MFLWCAYVRLCICVRNCTERNSISFSIYQHRRASIHTASVVKRTAMPSSVKVSVLSLLLVASLVLVQSAAAAITAELTVKCTRDLDIQAFSAKKMAAFRTKFATALTSDCGLEAVCQILRLRFD